MHPLAVLLGVLAILAGLGHVFIGGVANIFTLAGFFPVSIGIMVIVAGGVVTLAGVYL